MNRGNVPSGDKVLPIFRINLNTSHFSVSFPYYVENPVENFWKHIEIRRKLPAEENISFVLRCFSTLWYLREWELVICLSLLISHFTDSDGITFQHRLFKLWKRIFSPKITFFLFSHFNVTLFYPLCGYPHRFLYFSPWENLAYCAWFPPYYRRKSTFPRFQRALLLLLLILSILICIYSYFI